MTSRKSHLQKIILILNTSITISRLQKIILILNTSLAIGLIGLWVIMAINGEFWRGDFTAYYTGWTMIWDGKGADLYHLDLQTQYQQQLLGGRSFKDGVLPYVNPPHATLPFLPLALVPRSTAFWIWSAGQCGVLLWVLHLLLHIAQSWSPRERWLLVTGVLAFPSLLYTFMLGTFSLLMLLSMLQCYWSIKNNHDTQAGIWLAVLSIKPQLILVPGIFLFAARRWKALASSIFVVMIGVICSLVIPGWHSWQGFFAIIRKINTFFDVLGIVPSVMYNFKGTLTLMLGNEQWVLINRITQIALVVTIVVVWWIWQEPWNPDHPSYDGKIALTFLLGIFFSPHLFPHDGLLMVAPAIVFYRYLHQQNLPRFAYGAFVLICPILFLIGEFTIGGSIGIRIPVIAMIILVIWIGKGVWFNQPSVAESSFP